MNTGIPCDNTEDCVTCTNECKCPVQPCEDECTYGKKRCSGSVAQQCGDCDDDPCYEWCDVEDCSSKWDKWTCKPGTTKRCWKDGYCSNGNCYATYSSCSWYKDCGAECEAGDTKTCPDGTVVSCDTSTCTFPSCPSEIPEGAIRVFVTSKQYRGDLGGLGGADAKCQARADNVKSINHSIIIRELSDEET